MIRNNTMDALIIFNLILIIFNLNPFLRLDGYWILSDFIDEPNIHGRSMKLLNYIYNEKIYNKRKAYTMESSKCVKVYSLMYALVNLTIIIFGIIRVLEVVWKEKFTGINSFTFLWRIVSISKNQNWSKFNYR